MKGFDEVVIRSLVFLIDDGDGLLGQRGVDFLDSNIDLSRDALITVLHAGCALAYLDGLHPWSGYEAQGVGRGGNFRRVLVKIY